MINKFIVEHRVGVPQQSSNPIQTPRVYTVRGSGSILALRHMGMRGMGRWYLFFGVERMSKKIIDQRVFDLYGEYCHGYIDRREFPGRAGALTIGGVSFLSMAHALLPRYDEEAASLAWERTINFFQKYLG